MKALSKNILPEGEEQGNSMVTFSDTYNAGFRAGIESVMNRLSLAEKVALGKTDDGKVNTGNWYSDGVEAGIASAANDYLNDKVDLSVFDVKNEDEDSYTFGFECGYMRKLAEILVG